MKVKKNTEEGPVYFSRTKAPVIMVVMRVKSIP
jgi:hypothetical protein